MHTAVALLVFLLFYHESSSVPISMQTFKAEEMPAGQVLDGANILSTTVLSSDAGQSTLCSLYCKALRPCLGFLVQDGVCKIYFRLIAIADSSVTMPVSSFIRAEKRVLLLRHDKTNGGNFPLFATHGSWYLNEDNPEAPNYSIMGDVDNFKDKNGVYNFEMCYPKYPGIGDDYCFVFEQTSDPRRSSGVTENFILHHIPTNFENVCPSTNDCRLQGLTAENQDKTWLDGNPDNTKWCFAAGSSQDWPSGTTAFPGACYVNNGNGNDATSVYFMELYTYIPEL